MQLEVWRKGLFGFGEARSVRSGLSMFIYQGAAWATWKAVPVLMRANLRIPVNDALAAEIMGATRELCSHVGKDPVYSIVGKPDAYTCGDQTIGEDCYTVERCGECGYHARYPGNPRFRAATRGHYGVSGHPETTRLRAEEKFVPFMEADWSDRLGLVLPVGVGRLIVAVGTGHNELFITTNITTTKSYSLARR